MHVLDRVLKRTRPSLILASVAVTVGFTSTLGTSSADATSIPTKCPTGASISAAAGVALKSGVGEDASGVLLCTYKEKDANLEIEVAKTQGVTATIIKLVTEKAAATDKAQIKYLSGYGSFAAEYTSTKDAKTNADGIPSTGISCLVGDDDINVIGDLPAKNVLAVFKQVF